MSDVLPNVEVDAEARDPVKSHGFAADDDVVDAETIQDVAELTERFGIRSSLSHASPLVGDDGWQEPERSREHMGALPELANAIPFRLRQPRSHRLSQPESELRLIMVREVLFRRLEFPPQARERTRR